MKLRADLPWTSMDEMLAYYQTLNTLMFAALGIDWSVSFNLEFFMHNCLCCLVTQRSNFSSMHLMWYLCPVSMRCTMPKYPHTEEGIQIKRLNTNDLS